MCVCASGPLPPIVWLLCTPPFSSLIVQHQLCVCTCFTFVLSRVAHMKCRPPLWHTHTHIVCVCVRDERGVRGRPPRGATSTVCEWVRVPRCRRRFKGRRARVCFGTIPQPSHSFQKIVLDLFHCTLNTPFLLFCASYGYLYLNIHLVCIYIYIYIHTSTQIHNCIYVSWYTVGPESWSRLW